MNAALRRMGGLLSVYYAYMTAYRAELILWALANSLPFILMGAWYQAAAGGDFGFTPVDVARYFLAVFVIRQLTVVWVIWEFDQDVQRGRLSQYLLQPVDPAWRYLAAHLSERVARLPFSGVIIALFFLVFPPARFVPHASDVLLAITFASLAFALRFVMQYTLALFALWTERASSLESLMFILYLVLSGAIAPLEVFPPELRELVMWTPFPYFIWVPAHLLIGGTDVDLVRATLVCLGWIAALVVVNRVVWRRGLKRHSSMGA